MKDRTNPRRSVSSLFDPAIIVPAIGDSFRKLHPRNLVRNPVMFVVEIVTVLTTILYVRDLLVGGGELKFTFQIIVWLWITLLFREFRRGCCRRPRQGAGGNLAQGAYRHAGETADRS